MGNNNHLVSVVMAVYNESEHIIDAIESVFNQSFSNFEFIIIDDGSTDGTTGIIKSFDDDRIQLIQNQNNRGLPASLNRGIEAATGKYIARMDADDRSLPTRFQKQVEILNDREEVKVVGCWYKKMDVDGEKIELKKISGDIDWTPEYLQADGPQIAHPSVMIKKDALEEIGGYRREFTYAQDLDLWIRMARKYNRKFIYVIQESLFELRLSPERYKKKPLQRKFAKRAGSRDIDCFELNQIAKNTRLLSEREYYSRYYYSLGRVVLRGNKRRQAVLYFLKAISHNPYSLRPWYGLGLAFRFW